MGGSNTSNSDSGMMHAPLNDEPHGGGLNIPNFAGLARAIPDALAACRT
jgi:hypothetical protein